MGHARSVERHQVRPKQVQDEREQEREKRLREQEPLAEAESVPHGTGYHPGFSVAELQSGR